MGAGDDAGAARAAGRGQHVPQPGRRGQDGRDHRPRQPRPVDPGSRCRQRRLRERRPRHRSREDDGPADGLVRGIARDRRRRSSPARRSPTTRRSTTSRRPATRRSRSRRGSRSSSAPTARSAGSSSPPATPTSGSGSRRSTAWRRSATRTRCSGRTPTTEGRDATTIERMLGAKLILRSDPDEAQRVAEELVAIHKWGPSVWDAVWATTPERCRRPAGRVRRGRGALVQPSDRLAVRPRDDRAPASARWRRRSTPRIRVRRVMAVPGLDLVVTGGTVIDGTGTPRRRADVGVAAGRIVAIGDLSAGTASERIDATDRIVAPGWVDLHSHSDLTLLSDGRAVSKVAQGVTTEVNGNCGMGGVPLPPSVADLTRAANATIDPDRAVHWEWTDLAGYVGALHDTRPGDQHGSPDRSPGIADRGRRRGGATPRRRRAHARSSPPSTPASTTAQRACRPA